MARNLQKRIKGIRQKLHEGQSKRYEENLATFTHHIIVRPDGVKYTIFKAVIEKEKEEGYGL